MTAYRPIRLFSRAANGDYEPCKLQVKFVFQDRPSMDAGMSIIRDVITKMDQERYGNQYQAPGISGQTPTTLVKKDTISSTGKEDGEQNAIKIEMKHEYRNVVALTQAVMEALEEAGIMCEARLYGWKRRYDRKLVLSEEMHKELPWKDALPLGRDEDGSFVYAIAHNFKLDPRANLQPLEADYRPTLEAA